MLVIGSRALAVWASFKGKPFRTPADLDVICSREEMMVYCGNDVPEPTGPGHFRVVNHNPKWGIVNLTEFDLTDDCPSSQAYVDYVRGLNMQTSPIVTAPLDVLYSLKRSHRFIPWQWHKNIGDYHLLKSMLPEGVHPLEDITKMRMAERAAIKALKTPSLNKSRYGTWAGEPKGRKFDPSRCAFEVFPSDGSWIHHQCLKRPSGGPDKLYCKMHAKKISQRIG